MINLIYKLSIHVIMELEKQYNNKNRPMLVHGTATTDWPQQEGWRKGENPHGRAKAHEGLILFGHDKSN